MRGSGRLLVTLLAALVAVGATRVPLPGGEELAAAVRAGLLCAALFALAGGFASVGLPYAFDGAFFVAIARVEIVRNARAGAGSRRASSSARRRRPSKGATPR